MERISRGVGGGRKGKKHEKRLSWAWPQELSQTVMRIAVCKMRVRELISSLESVIRSRPGSEHLRQLLLKKRGSISSLLSIETAADNGGRGDAISELMRWYLLHGQEQEEQLSANLTASRVALVANGGTETTLESGNDKSLLHHLFPEENLLRRRIEPRVADDEDCNNADNASASSNSSGISLTNLTCSNCHLNTASDENDILLCDGMGCHRAYHNQCLEPKLKLGEMIEDDDWFCPLCTAHANLIHFAQREYYQDDWEELMGSSPLKRSPSKINEDDHEWEAAADVFPEGPFELRVAHKFKKDIRDDETTLFLEETLGVNVQGKKPDDNDNNFGLLENEDGGDESDDDFNHEDENVDDADSLAEDVDEEKRLLKDKIARDELDALSVGSSDEDDEGSSNGDEDDDDSGSNNEPIRRSKRRKFTLPAAAGGSKKREDSDDDEEDSRSRSPNPTDIGTLDVANIVRGKRRRGKVDYRKLADAMFGDEPDEDAKGTKTEYTFKPPTKKKAARKSRRSSSSSGSNKAEESQSESEDDSSDKSGDEQEATEDTDEEAPKKKRAKRRAK